MSFHAGTNFISGAGLSYCSPYTMSGRYEIFISGRHENFNSLFHTGMKIHVGGNESHAGMKISDTTIFSNQGDMKTKFSLFSF